MFDIGQFRNLIVIPALSELQLYSKEAEELMVFTCAAESDGGRLLAQIKGPALGVYQCEPTTHHDIWRNFIFRRQSLMAILSLNFDVSKIPANDRLIYDLKYATAICRIHYYRMPGALPKADDIDGIWSYYKEFYNTNLGKAKKEKAIEAYYRFLKKPQ